MTGSKEKHTDEKMDTGAATAAGAYLIAIAPRLCERPERMPKVYYAHRGLHDNISDAPENSLAAFQKRWMQAMALSWMCR